MIIDFEVIPHGDQRYETVGDWWWCTAKCPMDGGKHGQNTLHIRVSKLSDPRYQSLIFHHELTEALLCREVGVTTEMVDEWDIRYEKERETATDKTILSCGCEIRDEPGDDMHAPYYDAHQTATSCERIMAAALGVEWDAYDAEVESL